VTGAEPDQPSRFRRWDKTIEEWFKGIQADVERAAPEVLEELAKEVKGLAQRLEEMAEKARTKREQREGVPEPAEPPVSKSEEVE
jgi:hypothetical protein